MGSGSRGVPMTEGESGSGVQQFFVQADGVRVSGHVYFADALKAALLLKNENSYSRIKVRDLSIGDGHKRSDMAAPVRG